MKRLFIFIGLTFAIVCMNVQADEVVAQKVTDLTSLATLAYDVAVDKETRSRIYNQFVEIKNEVGDDPKAFLPILGEVILTVTTANTAEQWETTVNGTADSGEKTHLATRGTGNAIMTVMAGAAMVKDLPEIAEKLSERIKNVNRLGQNLSEFVAKTLPEKLEDIKNIWNTKYPAWEMMEGRTFFEDIMGEYRYTKADRWGHTADIADNFKGVDFYQGTTQGNQIFAETAVSMKTTIKTDVSEWLRYNSIQDNIRFLREGMSSKGMIDPNNNLTMFINNAEIHIYMQKVNITPELKNSWMNKFNTEYPDIIFEIMAIEDFIN
jgi:hypothetical protein